LISGSFKEGFTINPSQVLFSMSCRTNFDQWLHYYDALIDPKMEEERSVLSLIFNEKMEKVQEMDLLFTVS